MANSELGSSVLDKTAALAGFLSGEAVPDEVVADGAVLGGVASGRASVDRGALDEAFSAGTVLGSAVLGGTAPDGAALVEILSGDAVALDELLLGDEVLVEVASGDTAALDAVVSFGGAAFGIVGTGRAASDELSFASGVSSDRVETAVFCSVSGALSFSLFPSGTVSSR